MKARTKKAGRTGAKVGLGVTAFSTVRGAHAMGTMMQGGVIKPSHVALGVATHAAVHAGLGYGIGAGISAYRQHRENAHVHNFHTSRRQHTM